MFVRIFALAALCIAIQAAPQATAAATTTPAPPARTAPVVRVSYRVEYRKPGDAAWTLKGAYKKADAARAEMNALFDAGHEARTVRMETVTLLRTPDAATAPAETVGGISVVSYTQAVQAFRAVAARSDISFRYPADGCYARAYLMGTQIQRTGLKPGKAWAFDDEAFADKTKAPRLVATTTAHPRGHVSWKYHVAPALKVKHSDGKVYTFVIDPSLFDKPVSLGTWQKRMTPAATSFKPRMDVTAWGQPPRDGKGARMAGTGYWPGANPPDLSKAARETMAEYKPHEGTAWVRQAPSATPSRPTAPVRPERPVRTVSKVADTRDDLSP